MVMEDAFLDSLTVHVLVELNKKLLLVGSRSLIRVVISQAVGGLIHEYIRGVRGRRARPDDDPGEMLLARKNVRPVEVEDVQQDALGEDLRMRSRDHPGIVFKMAAGNRPVRSNTRF
jgi:hypothetical protein